MTERECITCSVGQFLKKLAFSILLLMRVVWAEKAMRPWESVTIVEVKSMGMAQMEALRGCGSVLSPAVHALNEEDVVARADGLFANLAVNRTKKASRKTCSEGL